MLSKNIELKRFTMRSASMSRQSDETFMLSSSESFKRRKSQPTPFPQENHTINIPSSDSFHDHVKKNDHLLKSSLLPVCDQPDFTECLDASRKRTLSRSYAFRIRKLRNIQYSDVDRWAKKSIGDALSSLPILPPHSKFVQRWNQFFFISCLVAIFIDPFFFFLLSVEKTNKCMVLNRSVGIAIAVVRSITDIIYLLHMLVQFKLAYVASDWTAAFGGQLVEEHVKNALHYLCGYFIFDLFLVLPLPQVMNLVVIPKYIAPENYDKYTLNTIVWLQFLQYIPRMFRFLPLPGGQSASGIIFESAWTNFAVNVLMFVLAGHVVGSVWYLFGFERVRHCLLDTCASFNKTLCSSLINCGPGGDFDFRQQWRDYDNSSNCLHSTSDQFSYGIYQLAIPLTTEHSVITRYIYSLFWGFQQISTLAGNQTPSYFVWEVLFTMAIVGIGLLLFALLVGNVQNILQAPERRRLEMQQKQGDMEQWMRNMHLPDELRERVREAERLSWRTTRGVNEEELLLNLPDNLKKEIHRWLYIGLLNKVGVLTSLDDQIFFDAITDKLRRKLYPKGSHLVGDGEHIDKFVFIVRGMLGCIHRSGDISLLGDGDVFGEELIAWCIEQQSLGHYKVGGKNRYQGLRLISEKTIRSLTNVEVLVLRADDIDQAISVSGVLCNPGVQMAVRKKIQNWRERAANIIQVAWRNRKWRLIKQQNTK
ncbi:putative cyclic nucleotide-gated ion channel 20, chloroplastic isoform X1 [Carex rostrata]